MVTTLLKSTLREIRQSMGRFLAILAIIALGVGFFSGLRMCQPAMMATGVTYLEEHRFHDFRLLSTLGFTAEDVEAFRALCRHADVGEEWCAAYFSEVQKVVEADLRNALLNDTKTVRDNPVLPPKVSQLCVWDAESILRRLPEIRSWFRGLWMLNIIDMQRCCSWFVCDDPDHQEKIACLFGVAFDNGVAKTPTTYLRKEIIRKTLSK